MSGENDTGFLDRTLRNLRRAWRGIAGADYDADAASLRPDLPDDDAERLREQMRACLESRGGEVSARARAAALGHAFLALNATGRARFLKVLADDFEVDPDAVDAAVQALREAPEGESRRQAERELRRRLLAPRVHLLTQFNALPEGVKFLVDMRAELLGLVRRDPSLKPLDNDLKDLLRTWFDIGFLELRRITWDSASGALLEKLVAYEAVHAIESWQDLKNRLDSDRRCFAFFHSRMPDEPLIFVEVALTNGMAGNIQDLLDEEAPVQNPTSADTAIFYSISTAQKGLAGIGFGSFLIKRVVDSLAGELKGLSTFATLSPIPGFMEWLQAGLDEGRPGLLTAADRRALKSATDGSRGSKGALKKLLSEASWHGDEGLRQALREPLMRLCSRYLIEERRPGGSTALDAVAHFHLNNGAGMERLNWLADTSAKGIEQSAGMMMNYLYRLDKIEDNHEAYTSESAIAASSAVRNHLKN